MTARPALGLLILALVGLGCQADSNSSSETLPASFPAVDELPDFAADLSVTEAYRAIPHRQTSWQYWTSKVGGEEGEYLETALHLVDEGVRLRVSTQRRFWRAPGEVPEEFDRLIGTWSSMTPPAPLAAYHAQVERALIDQKAFFVEWSAAGTGFSHRKDVGRHPKVQSSSAALKAAYGELMRLYPDETPENRTAFFDHHCALDFI